MVNSLSDDNTKCLDEGSHRCLSVKQTLQRIEPIAHKFGITRVADVTGLDCIGIPVTLAIRPNSKSVAVSQGKGATLAHAKASALMEAIEIWHAENMTLPVYFGSEQDLLQTRRIVDTDRLPCIPGSEFETTTPCLWVEGEELFANEKILVPYEMVHADYTRPIQPLHGYFPASTNGLASGNSRIEAICHAIAEVVERDALTLWHFTDEAIRNQKRIDPNSIPVGECTELVERLKTADLEIGIWNVTSDSNLPCILCIIRETNSRTGHMGLGSGCHPDASVALRRAITEAAQTRLNYISGARDDLHLNEYESDGIKAKLAYADDLLRNQACPLNFKDITSKTNPTLMEDLDLVLSNLSEIGIEEIVAVDLTKEEHEIPVARVVIPGLEAPHDDDNYVAGPRARKTGANG